MPPTAAPARPSRLLIALIYTTAALLAIGLFQIIQPDPWKLTRTVMTSTETELSAYAAVVVVLILGLVAATGFVLSTVNSAADAAATDGSRTVRLTLKVGAVLAAGFLLGAPVTGAFFQFLILALFVSLVLRGLMAVNREAF